jgi:hypothetical protein
VMAKAPIAIDKVRVSEGYQLWVTDDVCFLS